MREFLDRIEIRPLATQPGVGSRFRARVSDVHAAVVALQVQPFVSEAFSRENELVFTLSDVERLGYVSVVLGSNGIGLFELTPDVFNLRAYYYERMARPGGRTARPADPV